MERQTQILILLICVLFFFINEKTLIINKTFSLPVYLLLCSALVLCLLKPKIFVPVTKLWLSFGNLLQILVSPIILVFIYLLIFCPVALVRRVNKVRYINWASDTGKNSYWKTSDQRDLDFDKQY